MTLNATLRVRCTTARRPTKLQGVLSATITKRCTMARCVAAVAPDAPAPAPASLPAADASRGRRRSKEMISELRKKQVAGRKMMTLSESTRKLSKRDRSQEELPSYLQDRPSIDRSRTSQVRELHNTMVAAQEQLRPFCLSDTPKEHLFSSFLFMLHVLVRPILERFAPDSWSGFYTELARLGGPSGVLTLLTIARIDSDGTGDIDETELAAFDAVADKLIRETCDGLSMSALVASLLFGATFQSVIGRPSPMISSPESIEFFGETGSDALMWSTYAAMTLISILCLLIIVYAFGSRNELQNVLPSTQARLFFLCEVNPMNIVTSMAMGSMALFITLIITGGLLESPMRGLCTFAAIPFFMAIGSPLWKGMRNGPVRLRLEARAFLGIENSAGDIVSYGARPGSKRCRLKRYLAAHSQCSTLRPPPAILGVVEEAMTAAMLRRAAVEPPTAKGEKARVAEEGATEEPRTSDFGE